MSFGKFHKTPSLAGLDRASEIETAVCVAAICALAALPLLCSVALTIWGA